MNCTQCGQPITEGATTCTNCGAAVSLASATTPVEPSPAAPPPPAGQAPGGSGLAPGPGARPALPPFRIDAGRWAQNDRITGAATLVLFIALFLPWFGVSVGNRAFSISVEADGLTAHGYLYLVLVLCLVAFAYLVARLGWGELPGNVPVSHSQILLGLTGVNVVLTLIAFLFKPGGGGVGWRYGAFVALIAAVVAFVPWVTPIVNARRRPS